MDNQFSSTDVMVKYMEIDSAGHIWLITVYNDGRHIMRPWYSSVECQYGKGPDAIDSYKGNYMFPGGIYGKQ